MNKKINIAIVLVITVMIILNIKYEIYAADNNEYIDGSVYELGEKDKYDLSKANIVSETGRRFFVEGDFTESSTNDGIKHFDVNSGNLKLKIDTQYAQELISPLNTGDWKVINDKTKIVDSTKLEENIGKGAIIVQTSKDGVSWINSDSKIDFYNGLDSINNREINGENPGAFYLTSNVQLNNGCYYRIIVAYKMQKEDPNSKGLFGKKEEKERIEIYEFYACNPEAKAKQLKLENDKDTYEYSTTMRVDSSNGFNNAKLMESDDPHIDWNVGSFYINGFTRVTDEEIPVFLKTPKDKTVLWFKLDQDINKCNGNNDIKVDYTKTGSDIEFVTPTINDWGKGTLIVRKKDRNNKTERQIYTNYLEATATIGANNRIDLYEEGDYEVALDYQLHYDKPSVFGTKAAKTLSYRIKL